MLKNKIIIISLALIISSPAFSENSEDIPTQIRLTPLQTEEQTTLDTEATEPESTIQDSDDNITVEEPINISPYKQPISKRKIIKKFLLAMASVVASSALIFILLSIYNKIRASAKKSILFNKPVETELTSPTSVEDAVKTFLDKTKWD